MINHDNWAIMINTTLGLWAAGEWHNQPSVSMSKRYMADYLITRQDANGSWGVEHVATWWRTRACRCCRTSFGETHDRQR